MAALPAECSWCVLEFATNNSVLAVNRCLNGNLDAVALQFKGGMNNFMTEAASVIGMDLVYKKYIRT
jgi:hypothetical protein